jgi:hypothetical protein
MLTELLAGGNGHKSADDHYLSDVSVMISRVLRLVPR